MPEMDDLLREADPARTLDDTHASRVVSARWETTRVTRRKRRWRIALPLTLGIAAVCTGAAIAAPLVLFVGEEETQVEPDVVVPIEYTTISGQEVSCAYAIYLGGTERTDADERVAAALASTDWTGVGQEIYDHAVANPRGPQDGETWRHDSVGVRDAISFKIAVVPVLERRLPAGLQGSSGQWGSTDSCSGPFR